MNYIFDIDGTLTPHRKSITSEFRDWFMGWSRDVTLLSDGHVYLVTGSDRLKTLEQLGTRMCLESTVYQCAGNELWHGGRRLYRNPWPSAAVRDTLIEFIYSWLEKRWFDYPRRYARRVEVRPGMLNVSLLGRDCPDDERGAYNAWDELAKERATFASCVRDEFPDLDATLGGMISVDVYPHRGGKEQVVDFLEGPVTFFGDRTERPGNDWRIASEVKLRAGGHVVPVTSYEETWSKLRELKWLRKE